MLTVFADLGNHLSVYLVVDNLLWIFTVLDVLTLNDLWKFAIVNILDNGSIPLEVELFEYLNLCLIKKGLFTFSLYWFGTLLIKLVPILFKLSLSHIIKFLGLFFTLIHYYCFLQPYYLFIFIGWSEFSRKDRIKMKLFCFL